jgi:hypothetical protein
MKVARVDFATTTTTTTTTTTISTTTSTTTTTNRPEPIRQADLKRDQGVVKDLPEDTKSPVSTDDSLTGKSDRQFPREPEVVEILKKQENHAQISFAAPSQTCQV